MKEQDAIAKLENVIKKSRIHFYKPFQIAEILYQIRMGNTNVQANELNTYRTQSKKWRDMVSLRLTGNVCTSSAKFQDNLFDENACPPIVVSKLSDVNLRNGGSVEALIYKRFEEKISQMVVALNYINRSAKDFELNDFLDVFWSEPGLKRSIDKVFEIVIYAIFQTITEELKVESSIYLNCDAKIFNKFSDFSRKVFGISFVEEKITSKASFYRLGLANAADRGLDMYSNLGSIVQVKHLILDENLAKDVVSGVSSDSVVIVCKSSEKDTINNLLTQIGWKKKIKGIVTLDDLGYWYDICKADGKLGGKVLELIKEQMSLEFPSTSELAGFIKERGYVNISI